MRRLDSLLLAAVGVLIVHQIAYTLSAVFGVETSVAHGHLAFAWFGGSLALLSALARAITTSLRRRNHDAGSVDSLTFKISAGYAALEQIERIADGYGVVELFSEPVFWLGVALAPLVALALHWAVRSAAELVSFFLDIAPPQWPAVLHQPAPIAVVASPVSALLLSVVSRRGPPRS